MANGKVNLADDEANLDKKTKMVDVEAKWPSGQGSQGQVCKDD